MVLSLGSKVPTLAPDVFVAESAAVVGDVTIGRGSSVWYSAAVRGDLDSITIGEGSNIQDNVTLHSDENAPIVIGDGVSVGHNAVIHGSTIGNNSLIGMNATILNGAVIGANCIVGANALVTAGSRFPEGSLIVGCPAESVAEIYSVQVEANIKNAHLYEKLATLHRENAAQKD